MNPDSYCGIYCGACSVSMFGGAGLTDAIAARFGGPPKKGISCEVMQHGVGRCHFEGVKPGIT